MEVITIEDIDRWGACGRHAEEEYSDANLERLLRGRSGLTPLEVSRLRSVPVIDRIWVLLRQEVLGQDLYIEAGYEFADRSVRRYAVGSCIDEWAQRWLSVRTTQADAADAARAAWAAEAADAARAAWAADAARAARAAWTAEEAADAARAARAADAARAAWTAADAARAAASAAWTAEAARAAWAAAGAARAAWAAEHKWQLAWLRKKLQAMAEEG